MHDTFQLRDPRSAHMNIALGALLEGPGFQYDGVWFHRRGSALHCDAVIRPSDPIDDGDAAALINRAQGVLQEVAAASPVFARLSAAGTARFGVVDDCATSWRSVVELMDGGLVWVRQRGAGRLGNRKKAGG